MCLTNTSRPTYTSCSNCQQGSLPFFFFFLLLSCKYSAACHLPERCPHLCLCLPYGSLITISTGPDWRGGINSEDTMNGKFQDGLRVSLMLAFDLILYFLSLPLCCTLYLLIGQNICLSPHSKTVLDLNPQQTHGRMSYVEFTCSPYSMWACRFLIPQTWNTCIIILFSDSELPTGMSVREYGWERMDGSLGAELSPSNQLLELLWV